MSERCSEFSSSKIWVSKIIESKRLFNGRRPFVASILTFGLIPDLIFAFLYVYPSGFALTPVVFLSGAALAIL